jgi:hypothetical protein
MECRTSPAACFVVTWDETSLISWFPADESGQMSQTTARMLRLARVIAIGGSSDNEQIRRISFKTFVSSLNHSCSFLQLTFYEHLSPW